MALINRNHPKIIQTASGRNERFVHVSNRRFLFTKAASSELGLEVGKYIHFINDGKEWMFFQNDDPDGFTVVAQGRHHSGVQIISSALCAMFNKSLNKIETKRYMVVPISRKSESGERMFEILTHRDYKKTGDL